MDEQGGRMAQQQRSKKTVKTSSHLKVVHKKATKSAGAKKTVKTKASAKPPKKLKPVAAPPKQNPVQPTAKIHPFSAFMNNRPSHAMGTVHKAYQREIFRRKVA
jgi:hypothetical protein